jgi:hypothetical protein
MIWKRSKIKKIDYKLPDSLAKLILEKGEVLVESGAGMTALVEAFDTKENSGVECLLGKEIIYRTDPSNVLEDFFPVKEWKGPKIKRNGKIDYEPTSVADDIIDLVHEVNEEASYPPDLKEAVIGYVERNGMKPLVLLDKAKCYKIYMDRDGMSYKKAEEYFYYEVLAVWMGEGTPCFASLPSSEGFD